MKVFLATMITVAFCGWVGGVIVWNAEYIDDKKIPKSANIMKRVFISLFFIFYCLVKIIEGTSWWVKYFKEKYFKSKLPKAKANKK